MGFLVKDTIVIRYTIELVVSSGGALTRQGNGPPQKAPYINARPAVLLCLLRIVCVPAVFTTDSVASFTDCAFTPTGLSFGES